MSVWNVPAETRGVLADQRAGNGEDRHDVRNRPTSIARPSVTRYHWLVASMAANADPFVLAADE